MSSAYQVITCQGEAWDRGSRYGEIAAEDIRENLETYRELFAKRYGLTWEVALARVRGVVAPLQDFDEALFQELQGIAAGVGVDPIEIIALNARSTILYGQEECTSIAFIHGVGPQRGTMVGQNWDNMRRLRPVVLRLIEEGKPEILTLTEAGTLAKIGCNSAGIGLCVNGLSIAGCPSSRSIPIFVLIRRALQSASLGEALAVISSNPMDAPHNFKVASREGAAFDVESLYEHCDILPPRGAVQVHTNHILSKRLLMKDALLPHLTHSVVRLWRAEQLLGTREGSSLGVEDMKAVLSDHFDTPGAICRHGQDESNGLEGVTKHAIIMDLENGSMHVSDGYPCCTPFTIHSFDKPRCVE